MKIFVKLYIGIMAIIIASLLVSGYLMIGSFFKQSVNREVDNSVERCKMFCNSFQTNLILCAKTESIDADLVRDVVEKTSAGIKSKILIKRNGKIVYSTMSSQISYGLPQENVIKYDMCEVDGRKHVVCYSDVLINDVSYTCVLTDDITAIINENNAQRKRYAVIYLFVLAGGTLFAVLFSMHLTKPIRSLSEASKEIAKGNFDYKIKYISNDELGDLSRAFNKMSATLQDKVDALELNVRQKEDFIAAFAHETKSPMTSVIGYADYIYQNRLDDEERREAASIIMNEGLRLQALSEKLMDIVSLKKSGLKKEEIQTNEMIEDIRLTITPKLESKKAHIEFDVEDEYIYIDYDLFKTVIMNVIDNSLKAGAKEIKLFGKKQEGRVYTFTIKDNGMGIPENELRRVKEAFYMVDKSRSRKEHGAGLGLALCNRIMLLHGSRLDIKSKVGEGTTVILKLFIRSRA
ncbi:MAG: HAMP domain-containing histidine kinase [Eubacterium sp.]|nr:HAMP domain-containing histidine kinase [Eubacterium sp.]